MCIRPCCIFPNPADSPSPSPFHYHYASSLSYPESSSNSSFPSTIPFYRSASIVSLHRRPPFRSHPLNPFLAPLVFVSCRPSLTIPLLPPRTLALVPPHAFHSVVPTYSLALLLPDVCFSSLSLSATELLAMGPIQFPSCNFQSIHKRLSRRKPSTDVRIIAVRSNN